MNLLWSTPLRASVPPTFSAILNIGDHKSVEHGIWPTSCVCKESCTGIVTPIPYLMIHGSMSAWDRDLRGCKTKTVPAWPFTGPKHISKQNDTWSRFTALLGEQMFWRCDSSSSSCWFSLWEVLPSSLCYPWWWLLWLNKYLGICGTELGTSRAVNGGCTAFWPTHQPHFRYTGPKNTYTVIHRPLIDLILYCSFQWCRIQLQLCFKEKPGGAGCPCSMEPLQGPFAASVDILP